MLQLIRLPIDVKCNVVDGIWIHLAHQVLFEYAKELPIIFAGQSAM